MTARKVHLFGIQNEATREQTNYVLDEDELLDKGSNGTLSLVFDVIKKMNKGVKHLKLTCDNSAGQNKNNVALWFCSCLVMTGYFKSIELNFMIAGHTKFKVDGNFGMIKRRYHKSTIYTKEQFAEVVIKSSSLNKVQGYESGQGFQYLDFKVLGDYFHKLPKINRYHHFLFEAEDLGIVKIKEFADNSFIEFNLWKDKNVEKIRSLVFPILIPKPLRFERQEYLYQNIRPLVREEFREVTCPMPNIL